MKHITIGSKIGYPRKLIVWKSLKKTVVFNPTLGAKFNHNKSLSGTKTSGMNGPIVIGAIIINKVNANDCKTFFVNKEMHVISVDKVIAIKNCMRAVIMMNCPIVN